jgi:hypothetical protein
MMGQQTMESVAASRRIVMVVAVAALMALMMTATSAPAFAANGSFIEGANNAVEKSNDKATAGLKKAAQNHKS